MCACVLTFESVDVGACFTQATVNNHHREVIGKELDEIQQEKVEQCHFSPKRTNKAGLSAGLDKESLPGNTSLFSLAFSTLAVLLALQ